MASANAEAAVRRIASSARFLASSSSVVGGAPPAAAAAAGAAAAAAASVPEAAVGSLRSREANAGKRKANVLPDPVGDTPTMSVCWAPIMTAQHSAWIVVVGALRLGRLSVDAHASTSASNGGSTRCLTSANVVANAVPWDATAPSSRSRVTVAATVISSPSAPRCSPRAHEKSPHTNTNTHTRSSFRVFPHRYMYHQAQLPPPPLAAPPSRPQPQCARRGASRTTALASAPATRRAESDRRRGRASRPRRRRGRPPPRSPSPTPRPHCAPDSTLSATTNHTSRGKTGSTFGKSEKHASCCFCWIGGMRHTHTLTHLYIYIYIYLYI